MSDANIFLFAPLFCFDLLLMKNTDLGKCFCKKIFPLKWILKLSFSGRRRIGKLGRGRTIEQLLYDEGKRLSGQRPLDVPSRLEPGDTIIAMYALN
jgi:hypothetical protein